MQEFELVLTDEIRKGLRRFHVPKSEPSVSELYNIEPGPNGLEPYVKIKNPAGLDTEDGLDLLMEDGERIMLESAGYMDLGTWPFPQFFIGADYMVLGYKNKIYHVGDDWSVTEELTVPGGDVWDFVDFGTYFLMLNGEVIVYVDPTTGDFTQMASSSTMPRLGTACNFKGQIVGGDVRTEWHECGRDSIIYSAIGSASFAVDRTNEAGFRHARRKGNVLRVGRLGDHVVVYGENFVDVMSPVEHMFGVGELLDVGIHTKGAVGFTNDYHVLVDNKNYVWRIDKELKTEKLGYQEFMNTLVKTRLVISGVQDEGKFFISDGNKCYLLTPNGLCEVFQIVSSVATLDNAIVGTFSDGSNVSAKLTTGAMDFGFRGSKTLAGVEIGGTKGETLYCAVDLRYNTDGDFVRTPLVMASPDGFAYPNGTAHDVRVHIKASNYENFYLDHLNCKVKLTDRRFAVRGPYRRTLDVG